MKKLVYLLPLLFILLFTSCSKERRTERRLNGNTWNVDRIEWVKTYTGISGVSVVTGTEVNAGTYAFTSSTVGNANITVDGVNEDFDFDWSVSDEDITLSTSVQVNGWSTSTRVIAIEENGKKNMVWTLNEVQTDVDGAYTFTANMELSRN